MRAKLTKSPEVRQTQAAPPTYLSSSAPSPSLHKLRTVLRLYAEHGEELVLELDSHQTVNDKVGRGIHDNEKPGGFQFPEVMIINSKFTLI